MNTLVHDQKLILRRRSASATSPGVLRDCQVALATPVVRIV